MPLIIYRNSQSTITSSPLGHIVIANNYQKQHTMKPPTDANVRWSSAVIANLVWNALDIIIIIIVLIILTTTKAQLLKLRSSESTEKTSYYKNEGINKKIKMKTKLKKKTFKSFMAIFCLPI